MILPLRFPLYLRRFHIQSAADLIHVSVHAFVIVYLLLSLALHPPLWLTLGVHVLNVAGTLRTVLILRRASRLTRLLDV